jgi:hypothetical protein
MDRHRPGDGIAANHGTQPVPPKHGQGPKQTSLRLDQNIIPASRAQRTGWQSRMNEALRKATEAGSAIGFYLKPLLEKERVDIPVVKRVGKRVGKRVRQDLPLKA